MFDYEKDVLEGHMQNNKSFISEFENLSKSFVVLGVNCLADAFTEKVPDSVSYRLIEILEAEADEW